MRRHWFTLCLDYRESGFSRHFIMVPDGWAGMGAFGLFAGFSGATHETGIVSVE